MVHFHRNITYLLYGAGNWFLFKRSFSVAFVLQSGHYLCLTTQFRRVLSSTTCPQVVTRSGFSNGAKLLKNFTEIYRTFQVLSYGIKLYFCFMWIFIVFCIWIFNFSTLCFDCLFPGDLRNWSLFFHYTGFLLLFVVKQ